MTLFGHCLAWIDKKSHPTLFSDMKWQFHLTVFVKNLLKILKAVCEELRISFTSITSREGAEALGMWHRLCQCVVVTAMLEPLGDNPAAIDD
jgi:hypothetical protein